MTGGIKNPYAPPGVAVEPSDVGALLNDAARLFRVMGSIGFAVYLIPLFVAIALEMMSPSSDRVTNSLSLTLFCSVFCLIPLLLFAYAVRTGTLIQEDFQTSYRRARLIAIIMGVIWFPILTIPAVIAFRKMNAYRAITEHLGLCAK